MINETGAYKTRGLHHVVLTVTDVERSADFYGQVLGIKIGQRGGDAICLNDGLFHYCLQRSPTTEPGDRFDESRVGLDHVAFSVPSRRELEETLPILEALGVETAGIEWDEAGEADYICFRDPDNIQVELYASDRH